MIIEILVIIAAIIIAACFMILSYGIGIFNTLQVGLQDIQTQFSNVKTEYQRRADAFYNWVQAVKSHKVFEKDTLIGVAAARSGIQKIPTSDIRSGMQHLKGLDSFFSKLMVVMERYPKLQSYRQHEILIKEVRITEDRINVARTDYNEIVGDYNKVVKTFPSNVVASLFRIMVQPFFENEIGNLEMRLLIEISRMKNLKTTIPMMTQI